MKLPNKRNANRFTETHSDRRKIYTGKINAALRMA